MRETRERECTRDDEPSAVADDYTPTTEEVRGDYANFQLPASGGDFRVEYADALAEFDRWMADMLAAHDAEKRAEWETEQGEPSDVIAVQNVARIIAAAASDWNHNDCGDDDHHLGHSNWGAYIDDARAALRAAAQVKPPA